MGGGEDAFHTFSAKCAMTECMVFCGYTKFVWLYSNAVARFLLFIGLRSEVGTLDE